MNSWIFAACIAGSALISPALADDAYLDNRSSAESLVRSYYNAVNSHDYARAYTYFSNPPVKDFDTFQKGFADTGHVDVLTGDVSGEGAAGHTFYSVPTAIRAKGTDGKLKYFAGCYTVSAVNGPIQDPPSRPYEIDKASLKPIKEGDYDSNSLPKCTDQTADAEQPVDSVENAKAHFVGDFAGQCRKTIDTLGGINEPQTFTITYHQDGAAKGEPDQKVTLYVFECEMAAYNATEVFYLYDALGLHALSFAEPHLNITHPPGDEEGKVVKSMKLDGFTATQMLTNAEYDDKTKSISSFAKWRGIADASSNGLWTFRQGEFVLKDYDVDATYDGEQNPVSVIKDGKTKLAP